jgi:hypothetical protein
MLEKSFASPFMALTRATIFIEVNVAQGTGFFMVSACQNDELGQVFRLAAVFSTLLGR